MEESCVPCTGRLRGEDAAANSKQHLRRMHAPSFGAAPSPVAGSKAKSRSHDSWGGMAIPMIMTLFESMASILVVSACRRSRRAGAGTEGTGAAGQGGHRPFQGVTRTCRNGGNPPPIREGYLQLVRLSAQASSQSLLSICNDRRSFTYLQESWAQNGAKLLRTMLSVFFHQLVSLAWHQYQC